MAYVPKWMKNEKWIVEQNGKALNMMELARHFCLKVNWNKIADEAEAHARRVDMFYGFKPYGGQYTDLNQKAKALWENTEMIAKKRNLRGTRGTIRFTHGRGGHGGPYFGVEVGMNRGGGNMGQIVEVLIHEFSHFIHLSKYQEPTINGKRRPHDWLYNRIMLGAMNEIFKMKKTELNPYSWGYSVGNGYAPSRKAEKVMIELFANEQLPKKYAKFVQDVAIVEPKPEPTEEEKLKKKMGGFRRTLTSCLKGMDEYDGFLEVMDDSWNIADGREYILNLIMKVRPTMSIKEAGLDENEIVVLEWFVIEQQEIWAEYKWQYNFNWTQQENRMIRLHELWNFLNR